MCLTFKEVKHIQKQIFNMAEKKLVVEVLLGRSGEDGRLVFKGYRSEQNIFAQPTYFKIRDTKVLVLYATNNLISDYSDYSDN